MVRQTDLPGAVAAVRADEQVDRVQTVVGEDRHPAQAVQSDDGTTHTIGDGGYTTEFSARMEAKTKEPKKAMTK